MIEKTGVGNKPMSIFEIVYPIGTLEVNAAREKNMKQNLFVRNSFRSSKAKLIEKPELAISQ